MKKKRIFNVVVCLTTAIVIVQSSFLAFAGESVNNIDEVFIEAGVPQYKIEKMDDELKQFIIQNSGTDIEYIDSSLEKEITSKTRAITSLTSSDIDLYVNAFKVSGSNAIDIYPTYEWKKDVKPKGNDSFSFSVGSGFSVTPGKYSAQAWYKDSTMSSWSSGGSMNPSAAYLSGYEYKGRDLGSPDWALKTRGNCYFRVDIDSSNPVKKIQLNYVHDTTGSAFYGLAYGPASIGVNSSANIASRGVVLSLSY